MMDWTDSYCRVFHRSMTREARLYTEMVAAAALIHGPRHKLLAFDPVEQPLALQIGGADPGSLRSPHASVRRRAFARSTSMWAALQIACKTGALAPASCVSRASSENASPR